MVNLDDNDFVRKTNSKAIIIPSSYKKDTACGSGFSMKSQISIILVKKTK